MYLDTVSRPGPAVMKRCMILSSNYTPANDSGIVFLSPELPNNGTPGLSVEASATAVIWSRSDALQAVMLNWVDCNRLVMLLLPRDVCS